MNVQDRVRGGVVQEASQRKGVLGSVTWAVGVEATNVINVTGQAKDEAGNDMAEIVAFPWYFSSDAAGADPLTTAHDGGSAIGTDGALIESVANLSGLAITEADGDIDISITDAGAFTAYLVGVMPDGTLSVSAVITHAA